MMIRFIFQAIPGTTSSNNALGGNGSGTSPRRDSIDNRMFDNQMSIPNNNMGSTDAFGRNALPIGNAGNKPGMPLPGNNSQAGIPATMYGMAINSTSPMGLGIGGQNLGTSPPTMDMATHNYMNGMRIMNNGGQSQDKFIGHRNGLIQQHNAFAPGMNNFNNGQTGAMNMNNMNNGMHPSLSMNPMQQQQIVNNMNMNYNNNNNHVSGNNRNQRRYVRRKFKNI